jgi:CRP-like cAMP-binding protein
MYSKELSEFVNMIYPLDGESLAAFCTGWQEVTLKRKTVMTVSGETERYLYFVLEGIQRAFYLGDDGKDATIVFTYPPSFSGVADSFLTQTPSLYFLETITASRLLKISYEAVQNTVIEYPAIQQMIFKATALALKGALLRQVELQSFTNEEKFRTLLKRSPHILNLVPHKYLASYLGMDASNFSKLLGNVKI